MAIDEDGCMINDVEEDVGLPAKVVVELKRYRLEEGSADYAKCQSIEILGFRNTCGFDPVPTCFQEDICKKIATKYRERLKNTKITIHNPTGIQDYQYPKYLEIGDMEEPIPYSNHMSLEEAVKVNKGEKIICIDVPSLPEGFRHHLKERDVGFDKKKLEKGEFSDLEMGKIYTIDKTKAYRDTTGKLDNVVFTIKELNEPFGYGYFDLPSKYNPFSK